MEKEKSLLISLIIVFFKHLKEQMLHTSEGN